MRSGRKNSHLDLSSRLHPAVHDPQDRKRHSACRISATLHEFRRSQEPTFESKTSKLAPNGAAELKLVDGKVYAQLKLGNMAWLYDKLLKPSLLQAQFLRLLHLRRQGGAEIYFSRF